MARLGPQAKTDLLAAFHPDFRTESMRELLVGANRGERTPRELADLLEGNSRLDPLKIDLGNPTHDVDVLVIGGGGAGASAAITAQENGARCPRRHQAPPGRRQYCRGTGRDAGRRPTQRFTGDSLPGYHGRRPLRGNS